MIKKAFSLIEIIFTIAIISIILMVAVPKMGDIFNSANTTKIKSDILIIREAINNYKNKMILTNNTNALITLDDSDEYLFCNILQNPIKASNEPKIGAWSKIAANTYRVYIDTQNSVEFVYDNDDYSFECDEDNLFCQELMQ
jgi:prepilin-type N-terminal cleavage/methylation domain-containing protein